MMAARRCSICGINYPNDVKYSKCQVCEASTNWFNVDPHPDWEEAVARATADSPVFEDKVPRWRLEVLLRAGFVYREAIELAERRDIDLHDAIGLVNRGCDPHTAWEILH